MALIKPTKSLQNTFEMRQSVSLRLFNTHFTLTILNAVQNTKIDRSNYRAEENNSADVLTHA